MEARAASGRAGGKWAWGVARNAGEARQSEKSGRNEAENTGGEVYEAGKYERDEAENVGGEVCTNSKICARYGTSVHDAHRSLTKSDAENGTLPDISDQFVRERGLAASCHRAEVEIIVHRPAESYTGTDMRTPHHNHTTSMQRKITLRRSLVQNPHACVVRSRRGSCLSSRTKPTNIADYLVTTAAQQALSLPSCEVITRCASKTDIVCSLQIPSSARVCSSVAITGFPHCSR